MKHTLLRTSLSVILLAALLASCGEQAGTEPTEKTTDPVVTEAPTTAEPEDSLPADLDLEGKTMKLFIANYANSFYDDMYSAEETGNRISDAVYQAINHVEDRLNTTLEYTSEEYVYGDMPKMKAKITGIVLANDPAIDLYFDVDNYSMQMLDNPYFIDLSDTPYINLDSPWYDSAIVDVLPGDYVYCLTGNFALANIKYSYVTFFNTGLLSTLDIDEDLYKTVESGKWTVSHMQELIKGTYQDLNGDSQVGPEDRFGLTFGDVNKFLGLGSSCGVDIFTKNGDKYDFTYGTERTANVMASLQSFVNECIDVEPPLVLSNASSQKDSGSGNKASIQFLEGRSLFSMGLIADAPAIIPEVDFTCGILPMPKFAEEDEYHSPTQRHCYAFIPTSSAEQDYASATLEALSSAFYHIVNPEFVEVTLKTRYSADDNVSRMYDLIMQTHSFETYDVFESLLNAPGILIKDALEKSTINWASSIERSKEKWEAQMEKATQVVW